MDPLTLLLLLFVGAGLLLAGISIPLIQRRIKPNWWYGFRTPRTVNNPAIWYDVNAYAGKRLLISGLITTVAALVLYFIPGMTIDGYVWGMTVFSMGPIIVGAAQSFRYLNQLTR
jgi:uncharacterized membrane protein